MREVVCDISVSANGYAAGPGQTLEQPFGTIEHNLHDWMFETPKENQAELDAILASGAFIIGRNMFAPGRGDWDLDTGATHLVYRSVR